MIALSPLFENNINGKCLKRSISEINKNGGNLIMGPSGQKGDTAHFWVERNGKIIDRTKEAVSSSYEYNGRIVNVSNVLKELKSSK
jgi:hypothetical protein